MRYESITRNELRAILIGAEYHGGENGCEEEGYGDRICYKLADGRDADIYCDKCLGDDFTDEDVIDTAVGFSDCGESRDDSTQVVDEE